jgi:hypothetical protein
MARPRNFSREGVLEKALPVFWKHGFADAGLQELEKATWVNKSGLVNRPIGFKLPWSTWRWPRVISANLCDAELRFHPAEEMRVRPVRGPEQPVAARTFHRRREGGHQLALRDELREKIG